MDRDSADEPSSARVFASWLWAFAPALTFGVATAPVMIWATIYRRSWAQGVLSAFYVVATVIAIVGMVPSANLLPEAQMLSVVFLMFGGLINGLAVRRWVFGLPPPLPLPYPQPDRPMTLLERQQAAIEASREEAKAREVARKLVEDDPYEALRLQIGRVDIAHRAFPDGGLIDVNNVPPSAFAEATELSLQVAHRIAVVREKVGGFGSVDELCSLAELPPQTFDHLTGRLVFPPKVARGG
jgi:Helix-hairpin-helix motif